MVDEELSNIGDKVRQEAHDRAEGVAEQKKKENILGKQARKPGAREWFVFIYTSVTSANRSRHR